LGHDLRAALLAALAVGTYRHARRSLTPLAEIGKQIDEAVRAEFPDSCFVTGLLGELNVESGMFCWANAGHPPPLLLRDGHVHRLIGAPDQPWGLHHRRSAVERVNLQPRDQVLLHTDGIVEARSPSGEPFGADRLADLLVRESLAGRAAPELLRRILDAVMEHRSAALQDDATAVLIEWRGPGERPSLGG
jgi:serine phosphatase RsbU (regulator of sigma subunit)